MSVDHPERIRALSDADLRQELIQAGEAVGPILASTRQIFERKLLRCLLGDQEHKTDEVEAVVASAKEVVEVNDGEPSSRSSEESATFFGVAVPSTSIDVKTSGS